MMSNCKLCLADCAFKGKDMKKGNCKGYIPMSNADRIRAMKEQEERRERRVAHMEELTKEMAAIMRGLRRMKEREEKNERENVG